MKYILGVDAGGTKTIAQIAAENGKVLGEGVAGAVHMQLVSNEQFIATLANAVADAVHKAGTIKNLQFDAAFLGIAGIDSIADQNRARELVSKVVSTKNSKNLYVENDVKIVRAAGSNAAHGVAVISGTGSNVYGVNKKGKEAWAIGLGPVMSDEGSSWWIGERALRLADRSYDGRGEKTALEQELMRHFGVNDFRELSTATQGLSKKEVAELSPLVERVALKKDKIAAQIFTEAAAQLALGVNTVVKNINMQNEVFDIVASGGTFNSGLNFGNLIQKNLEASKAKLIVLKEPPVNGALKLARQLLT
ncbi:MAG: hypothetical protein A2932_01085 [Candidatus Spechtbacteria bacterium RIFCSPLOWO2_01_FULL_46_10]|uniref:ATPase BadF/BadG/BcrA/BcrD type domain-containing protein n=1 Tax=Candidatus Spechtbacteria bacterium RIFCSPLOWO2_01_FULL_46_10 TaxID=1802163 RepID=A0A1G2HEZ3_9BACT|nr:MAG: hypothetical protein A2932_01085 [Candidatus Spechtbacteria bacterium RIFCSPLOWO2_01_FULL_46_10]